LYIYHVYLWFSRALHGWFYRSQTTIYRSKDLTTDLRRVVSLPVLPLGCGYGEAKNNEAVEAFIKRWQGREGGQERANYVSFLNELISLIGMPLRGLGSHSIDPHQFLGLEINPRAAAIAELVLWIGYLQWHFRTKGAAPEEPILRAFKNIQVKNAVLTWDGEPFPKIVDRKETYPNARRPEWPAAEFIVGNPPFIGKGSFLRAALGDAQTEALWAAHPHISDSTDFVLYWWDRAAELLTRKGTVLRRFGLVTTNSITQAFNRKVIEKHFKSSRPISLVMAIPDHPWTKASSDSAAVRIAMTVVEKGRKDGILRTALREDKLDTDQPAIELDEHEGMINSDLTIGADVTTTSRLSANAGLSSNGMLLAGRGFVVNKNQAEHLGLGTHEGFEKIIRPYINGRELLYGWSGRLIIDLFGLSLDDFRRRFPAIYQHLAGTVKSEREAVASKTTVRDAHDYAAKWWQFAKVRRDFRTAIGGLDRYIGTTETTKHRLFQFIEARSVHDHMVIGIASDDAWILGVLSSHLHLTWALRSGGWLGVGNDPRYSKSKVFDPFPFPDANNIQKQTVRLIAEELDAHRKRVLAEHPHLTLTGLYNVLEMLCSGTKPEELNNGDRAIFDDGLVLIIKELHDKLDAAVADAYGWPADLSDDEILVRLVALNKERSAEEKRGLVRWLRPDYQIPRFAKGVDKQAAKEEGAQVAAELIAAVEQKPSFPSGAVEQTAAIFAALAAASQPLDANGLAAQFRRTKTTEKKIGEVLASLARLGYVTSKDGNTFALRRAA
jgi:restriction-modification enzyme MmeI-like protein